MDVSGVQSMDDATVEMPAIGTPAPKVQATMRQVLRDATLGEYEILSELGRGGMATVFLAHDISLDRKVAIKVMSPHLLEGEGMAERFKLEARTAAQLSHPHIIPIYAVRETESTLFFVMKYIEGRALDEIIKKSAPLPIPMVKDILRKVGAALGYAHRRDVVHRDVKPGNVMIDDEGTPIVTDFGIAKVAETRGLTMTGTTIGTPSYMSPEQCEAKEVTGASDQYSLGVVAFEMLTGQLPFEGDTAVSTMYKHCHEPLPPLQDFRPDCPPDLLETVTRMLAKAPSDRWPSLESAIQRLGSGTDPFLDPVRNQLMELARDTDPRELLAQLATPRTPMPGVATGAGTASTSAVGAQGAPKRRSRLVGTVVAVAAVGVAAAVVTRPWSGDTAPSIPGGGGEDAGAVASGQPQEPATQGGETPPTSGVAEGAVGGGSTEGEAAAPPRDPATRPAAGGEPPVTRPAVTQPPRATSIVVEGVPSGMEVGDEALLSVRALASSGASVDVGAPTWTSSDPSVARVDPDGRFAALQEGTVVVTASVAGVSGSETVVVSAASARSIRVDPQALSLTVGERSTITAEPIRRDGRPIRLANVRWSSSDPAVATVDRDGTVSGVAPGRATVRAQVLGASEEVPVTVTARVVDARTAVATIVADWERAFESRDIQAVRRVFPGMTAERQRATEDAFAFMQDIQADFTVASVTETDGGATAEVGAVYRFVNATNRRREEARTTLIMTFQRLADGWRLVGMESPGG